LDHINGDVYGVATNNVFTGAFRGFGSPQINFAVEQIMDMAAERLGLSPLEIRRRNALVQDAETITGQKLNDHTVSLIEVMEKTAEKIDFEEKLKKCSRGEGEKWYGIGMAASYRGCSVGAEAMDFCCATINIQFDGSILLDTAVFENGQGASSAMILILAKELGVPPEAIQYQNSSTASIPDGGTTVASRGTLVGGGAIMDALSKLKPILRDTLHSGIADFPEQVEFRDNRIWGTEGRSLSWAEAGRQMYLARVYPFAFGTFQAPKVSWDEETGRGNAYFSYVYSCQAAEVEVNTEKGSCRLLNIVANHDIGRVINPPMAEGQIHGGVVQGVGMALTEDFRIEEGRVKSLNFSRYKIPRMTDLPDMTTQIVENPDPLSPTGAKGIGEPALEIIAPAIANAVAAATGRRFTSLPLNLKKELNPDV
jgi:CO/xanthine dehydrogenase Mo-binding subunit